MFKRFIDGLVFGTGFSAAFVVVWIVAIYYILPGVIEKRIHSTTSGGIHESSHEIRTVPAINLPDKFLDTTNVTSGDFKRGGGVLAGGNGRILGGANANGEPVSGLKLRLALNGSVYSQWATTDGEGKYAVHVPYGEYVINGYEFDQGTADKYLANKILSPQSSYSSNRFKVSSESTGRGLDFRFVNPVIKKFKSNKFRNGDDVILEWEDYPGASTYTVQVREKPDPYTWSNVTLFKWSERPEVLEPRINLKDYDVHLTPGKFYSVEITAKGKDKGIISKSADIYSGYDFEIVK